MHPDFVLHWQDSNLKAKIFFEIQFNLKFISQRDDKRKLFSHFYFPESLQVDIIQIYSYLGNIDFDFTSKTNDDKNLLS